MPQPTTPRQTLACFKAYDIRGRLDDELNPEIAYCIGRAYARHLGAKRVVVGGDARATSEELKRALARGMQDEGCDVLDLGMTGTEQIYFAAFHLDVDGGIQVTASHNPIDYNGMKLVGRGARPISGDSGLKDIQTLAEQEKQAGTFFVAATTPPGKIEALNLIHAYIEHILGYIDLKKIRPLRLVTNAGNGAAGPVIDAIEQAFVRLQVPIEFIKIHHQPDATFPNGIPNPLLPENRVATAEAVRLHKADFGLAWDGDFDRCFFFDEQGDFIEGYYLVGLLAQTLLERHPGAKIIHDPRLTWNTIEQVQQAGGVPVQAKTGHAFIKERMRAEDALYGGEMSAHHYFRDFAYCDSGMIPWLLIAERVSASGQPLSALVKARMVSYPCSGEINYKVNDVAAVLERVQQHFAGEHPKIDTTDGLGLEFASWRLNIRASNTEPLLRLNIETRANPQLLQDKILELQVILGQ